MNTALLSARKRTGTGELRALTSMLGEPALAWQVAIAKKFGCERIICLCDAPIPEIIELQRKFEGQGGEFHAIRSSLQLVALLRSDDALLMIQDGLIVEPDLAKSVLVDDGKLRKAILTLEVGSELTEASPADFERIDATRCWAGIATMRAAHLQQLADLPSDGDVFSLSLRLALQSRTGMIPLHLDVEPEADWLLASDAASISLREKSLLDRALPAPRWTAPFPAIASKLVGMAAKQGYLNVAPASAVIAGILAIAAIAIVALGYAAIGLSVASLAALFGCFYINASLTKSAIWGEGQADVFHRYFRILLDSLAIISLVLALKFDPIALASLPIFTVGLFWLAERNASPRVAPFWNDRTLHLATLAICAAYGVLSEGLALLGLLALVQSLWRVTKASD
ncbi:hypothetical protein [Erythrobacter sp. F6033]|uniref:hypothetical protein n=1 Tax=Erythrobacter sp. F6033 TaxID=2926401 RepID=UPI001FF224F8|nr:hypothetical protein [Erythrobacter sp. F6033]MCK0128299.1 hypothetical protein [Erythrobacter sp. F6033]